jgi:hypothetical protein
VEQLIIVAPYDLTRFWHESLQGKEKGIVCAATIPLVATGEASLAAIVSPAELPFAEMLVVLSTMLVSLFILRAVAILFLRSSGESEVPAKSGSGLLSDEHDPQKLPYEEGRTLREEPERERQGNLEAWQKAEQLALEHEALLKVQQEAEQLDKEYQQMVGNLRREQEERLESQQRAERLEQERLHLEQEHQRLKEETDNLKRLVAHRKVEQPAARRPSWRNITVAVVLLLGILVMWFTSLVVALSILYS